MYLCGIQENNRNCPLRQSEPQPNGQGMNKNTVVTTLEEIQNLPKEVALEIYFQHQLATLPRLIYDKQNYQCLKDENLVRAMMDRVKEFIDLEWGGLQLSSVGWVSRAWPNLRSLAGKHRHSTFEARIKSGAATKVYVGGLPSDASFQSIVRGLELQHPYDLMPVFEGNHCRGFAFLIVSAETAEKLLQADPPKIVSGSEVTIRPAWSKRQ